jgi:trehalose 6-phosphate phosphatase
MPPPPLTPQDLPRAGALFLDVDGTLAPIEPRPEDVRVGPQVLSTLQRLQGVLGGALALISGRPITELDALFAPLRMPCAGVHGAQRRDGSGRVHNHVGVPPAAVFAAAREWVARHPALRLEIKPAAIALHYRAQPELGPDSGRLLRGALAGHPDWDAMDGHCVVEVKPRGVSKGHALRAFMEEAPFQGRTPVMIGDDVTDEDAFAAAQAMGGMGIKVGPGATQAMHRLDSPQAVLEWLGAVLQSAGEPR